MRKVIYTLITVCLFTSSLYAQKKVLDTANYKEWTSLGIPEISLDGKWVIWNAREDNALKHLVNTKTGKEIKFKGVQSFGFLDNGQWIKYVVSGKPKDSTILMRLKDGKKIYWNRPEYFQDNPKSAVIFYTMNVKGERSLILRNLNTGDSTVVGQTDKFNVYSAGSSIIYIKDKKLMNGAVTGKHAQLAADVSDYEFNEKNKTLSYVADNKLYAYSFAQKKAELLLDFNTITGPDGFKVVTKAYTFKKGDQDLQLEVTPMVPVPYKRPEAPKVKATGFDLELWTWNEDKSQRLQRKGSYLKASVQDPKYIYHTSNRSWFKLPMKDQGFVMVPESSQYKLVLQTDPEPYKKMVDWRYGNNLDIYTVNTYTNERKLVATDSYSMPQWSPNGKYGILFNAQAQKWMVLEEKHNEFRQISDQIGFPVHNEMSDTPTPAPAYGIAGWLDGGNSLLIYDSYDIWKIDLTGSKPASSLTGGYGRRNHVVLRLQGSEYQENLDLSKPVLLTGFRESTKSEGIYQLVAGKSPLVLIDNPEYKVKIVDKAEDGSCVLTKQSYTMYPDIWVANPTFSKQTQLTHVNLQQKKFNWGTAKVVKWKTFDGKDNEGLLYLPEGYDAKKTYPMIVDFYETHSQDLHNYLTPLYSTATIDIPSYVSKGYIVFRPDVHFTVGIPGESAYNCVVSGTEYLIKNHIADPAHIGLQGHSWSGFEVAYILTRTPMYTCSNVGAGVVNSTYNYFAIRANGAPCMFKYEVEQSRIGGSLWDKTDEFIKNSPIFNADKIKTPLLIFHNDKDGAVAFTQGLDLFLAMRRLEKPAWLLNYKGQNHTLESEPAQQDWTLRMEQFFDHYLKEKPMPRWMAEGINVDERNVDLKYDY